MTEDQQTGSEAAETVRQRILREFEAQRITPKWLVRKLKQLSNAKRTQYFSHQGQVYDERTTKDNSTQLQATSLIVDILGGKAPAKQEHSGEVELQIHIIDRFEEPAK